jgi:tRNA U34 2-thiouridine synthase MnmA/TrmU
MKKAYLLFSGGLDSVIAAKVLQKLGFKVIGVHITSPFFEKEPEKVRELAEKLGIELQVVEAGDDYLEVLKNPVYGYGKNVNPCIDCKAYMLRKLKEVAGEGAIVATGEVLGQRPMSQRLDAFRSIEKLSGLKGKVLRPLSGKVLPETVYEREGIVEREKLLDLKGRSRKRYPEILKELGINEEELPTPAGGCLLTEPSFAVKVKDLMEHGELNWENVKLLKVGRHFRIKNCKLTVGRNREENGKILKLSREDDLILKVEIAPSPIGLLRCRGKPDREVLETAAAIVARYSDAKRERSVPVSVYKNGKLIEEITVSPLYQLQDYALRG